LFIKSKNQCPSAASISPCICVNATTGIYLNCYNLQLTDSQMNTILNVCLSPGIGPVIGLAANKNKLTQIPSQISSYKLPHLSSIDLSQNAITYIPPGAFNLTSSSSITLYLYQNRIPSIPSGAITFTLMGGIYSGLIYLALGVWVLTYFPASNRAVSFCRMGTLQR